MVHFHYTPTPASWLNQVEVWFSILTPTVLRHLSATDPLQICKAIDRFTDARNEHAHPLNGPKTLFIPAKPNHVTLTYDTRSRKHNYRRSLLKPSVPQSVAELKALLKDLDKFLLRKALELAREWYRAILEEVDELLAKRRAEDLTADGDTFWAGMTFHQRYDLTGVKDTVVGGDGAGWVKEGVSYVNGRFQLDRYHSHRELCRALGRDSETKRRVWNACEDGTVEVGLALLAEAKGKARGEQAEKIARVYRYRQANSSGLGDYRVGLGEEGEYIMS